MSMYSFYAFYVLCFCLLCVSTELNWRVVSRLIGCGGYGDESEYTYYYKYIVKYDANFYFIIIIFNLFLFNYQLNVYLHQI